jgi:hypothetical protein
MKNIILIIIAVGFFSCYRSRNVTIKVKDVDTGNPVSDIQVIISDVEHHSSGNTEKVIYTNSEGIASYQFFGPKKDMIKIQLNGKNGYRILDESTYYYNYQRRINITVSAKK